MVRNSIYLQVFFFYSTTGCLKKVLQILNDSGQEIDTMQIEDLNGITMEKEKS